MLERSRRNAVSISQNYRLMNALENQNFDQMKSALDELNQLNASISEVSKQTEENAAQVRRATAQLEEAGEQTASLIGASVETVEKGSLITTEAAQIVQDAIRGLAAIIEDIGQVEQASNQQSLSIEQIRQGLEQVSTVVQSNAATAEENSAISEEMSAQAAVLRKEVAKFKLHHAELLSASDDFDGSPYSGKAPSAYALIGGKY